VIRIMPIGDSITHSENGHHSWRYRLHEHLRGSGVQFDFVGPWDRPHGDGAYAVEGWDSDHYARWGCIGTELVYPERFADPRCDPGHTIVDRVRTFQPDVLLVHLGSNDLTYHTGPAGMRDTLRGLIQMARGVKPNIHIILAQIGQVSLFGTNPTASQFAPLVAELAAQETRPDSKVAVAAVHPAWSMAADTDAGGTHPNVRGEFVIAKAFADSLYTALGVGRWFGDVPERVGPPPVTGITVEPSSVVLGQPFTVRWPRVANPGVWTPYKVQVRFHRNFGYKLIWESQHTPDLSVTYNGPRLPQTGIYHIVVVSMDPTGETASEPVELEVRGGPPKVTGIGVQPASISRGQPFTVTWPRVVNPGIWTTYKVQLRYHQNFGFGVVWESAPTTDLSVTYNGPRLPQAGVYHVVVVSMDGTSETLSDPIPLPVADGPPKVTGIGVPAMIQRTAPFTVTWPRVVNPGIWTTYKVQLRYHQSFGFGLLWESAATTDLSVTYNGPTLPQTGIYHVVVVSMDGTSETPSDPVPLPVHDGPPKVTGIALEPSAITAGGAFSVSWPRVVNPGIWTVYRVEVHHHSGYGFGLVWRSPETVDLSMPYTGPALTPGVYHVVVISTDGSHETMSDVASLEVR
jgi:GDSL-like Lipase/Acylhydrolase family